MPIITGMSERNKYTTVSIPVDLAEKCRELIKDTGFKSMSDYVTFILREIIISRKEWDNAETVGDKERITEKLRKLGYL